MEKHIIPSNFAVPGFSPGRVSAAYIVGFGRRWTRLVTFGTAALLLLHSSHLKSPELIGWSGANVWITLPGSVFGSFGSKQTRSNNTTKKTILDLTLVDLDGLGCFVHLCTPVYRETGNSAEGYVEWVPPAFSKQTPVSSGLKYHFVHFIPKPGGTETIRLCGFFLGDQWKPTGAETTRITDPFLSADHGGSGAHRPIEPSPLGAPASRPSRSACELAESRGEFGSMPVGLCQDLSNWHAMGSCLPNCTHFVAPCLVKLSNY